LPEKLKPVTPKGDGARRPTGADFSDNHWQSIFGNAPT
jgi:hypothetical protein